ncbi:unnamed protein product [Periconia digitata]|uniref:histidine kinase n=1 Tax=Periconia digitata TaxID=1303443 RepID=A0A9W4UCF6_9PLEO|nr:unnamed protein product [Periconia digitata]
MENLDRLTTAGVGVFDLNSEYLSRKNWAESPFGARHAWPAVLNTLVNSCLLPIPHPAAIFWGSDLAIAHNLAWGKARGDMDGQGTSAHDSYSEEALSALSVAMRGRTIKVAYRFFLSKDAADNMDAQLLLSTLLDEHGKRQGVLAQWLQTESEKYLPISGLDEHVENNPARQTKETKQRDHGGENGNDAKDGKKPSDSRQTQLFHRFAELLPHGLAVVDSEAESIFVNDAFFKLTTNKSKNEFRAWPESIHPQDYDRVMSAYREAFSNRGELSIEFRCAADARGEAGEWRLFMFKPLSKDPEAGYICAVIDITEIKQAQIAQEKAATEAKDRKEQQERFIDMVSHEIRNPLSAVLHLAEEIKDLTRDLTDDQHQDLEIVTRDILDAADTILLCVSHQNTLVDDILSFSKLDSMMLTLVPREIQPKWGFSTALKVFQSEFKAKQIQFHYAMDVSFDELKVDYVVADLNRMKQVLVNLITNAIKFTAKKNGERRITVSLGASPERPTSYPPNVIFFSEDKNSFHIDSTMTHQWGSGSVLYLMVAVRDTGIGISQDDQAKLFGRFRQATPKTQENYGGSGLGLFISRKLCQLHGGDIGVSSKEGEGSTFGFFFKVRTAIRDKDRPTGSRTTSDSSNAGRSSTPIKRPGYSRANSALRGIDENKENTDDRPQFKTLASHEGVTPENVMDTLKNPPTEESTDARPSVHKDNRYEETKAVADKVDEKSSYFERKRTELPDLTRGETTRQESAAEGTMQTQINDESNERNTLLLVEDNLINQKVLRRQLQSKGFEVSVANNGQEAIDVVAERGRNADGHEDFFNCILMDQEMPIKDGNAATREIRGLQAQNKAGRSLILGVSANVREAQTTSMLDAGMDAVISKPFKVDDLVKKIRSMLPRENSESQKKTG